MAVQNFTAASDEDDSASELESGGSAGQCTESESEVSGSDNIHHRSALARLIGNDDPVTAARSCFWFGLAFALGFNTLFNLIIRDVAGHSQDYVHGCLVHKATQSTDFKFLRPGGYIYMFSGLDNLTLFSCSWACVLYICQACTIDYMAVLKNHPLVSTSKSAVLIAASKQTCIVTLLTMCVKRAIACDFGYKLLVPVVHYIPAVAYFLVFCYTIHWTGAAIPRLVFGACACICIAAGVTPIDTLVGNMLTSLTKPMQAAAYSICTFASLRPDQYILGESSICHEWFRSDSFNAGFVILMLPNLLRFAQILRQLWDTGQFHPCATNAFKYLLSLSVTVFSVLHGGYALGFEAWLTLAFCQVLYSYVWDITVDWGLVSAHRWFLFLPCGAVHLREKRLLTKRAAPYIFLAVVNFIARFFFIYTLIPTDTLEFASAPYGLLRVFAYWAPIFEIIRRLIWCVLSFEYKWLAELDKLASQSTDALQNTSDLGSGVDTPYTKLPERHNQT